VKTEAHLAQRTRWPARGRHILAQFDADSVVVYQAYRPSIGEYAAAHGDFLGGGFSLDRMSWIKPNFLWMMYRCGWAQKDGQEVVLAVTIQRAAFDAILAAAVPSSHDTRRWATHDEWKLAVAASDVRLQWDPDHGPGGEPLERRAIQLGMRGKVLAQYAKPWILSIEDITPFVREQHVVFQRRGELVTPREEVYPCTPATAEQLGLDSLLGGDSE
jgi:hypothetical protein